MFGNDLIRSGLPKKTRNGKKGIFAPPYGYLSDIFLPSASGYVLATYYRYDIDRENPKLFAGKNIENALRRPYTD